MEWLGAFSKRELLGLFVLSILIGMIPELKGSDRPIFDNEREITRIQYTNIFKVNDLVQNSLNNIKYEKGDNFLSNSELKKNLFLILSNNDKYNQDSLSSKEGENIFRYILTTFKKYNNDYKTQEFIFSKVVDFVNKLNNEMLSIKEDGKITETEYDLLFSFLKIESDKLIDTFDSSLSSYFDEKYLEDKKKFFKSSNLE